MPAARAQPSRRLSGPALFSQVSGSRIVWLRRVQAIHFSHKPVKTNSPHPAARSARKRHDKTSCLTSCFVVGSSGDMAPLRSQPGAAFVIGKGEQRSGRMTFFCHRQKNVGAKFTLLRRGAAGGSRTRTPIRTQAPQACQSTSSSTAADHSSSTSCLIIILRLALFVNSIFSPARKKTAKKVLTPGTSYGSIFLALNGAKPLARVVELVDSLASGASVRKDVRVRLPPRAPRRSKVRFAPAFLCPRQKRTSSVIFRDFVDFVKMGHPP